MLPSSPKASLVSPDTGHLRVPALCLSLGGQKLLLIVLLWTCRVETQRPLSTTTVLIEICIKAVSDPPHRAASGAFYRELFKGKDTGKLHPGWQPQGEVKQANSLTERTPKPCTLFFFFFVKAFLP